MKALGIILARKGSRRIRRKNIQPLGLSLPTDGKEGKISEDRFKKSVPGIMKVGKAYTASVQVKNTGDSRTTFIIFVHSDGYTIFVDDGWRSVTLDKGSSCILKFKIVPIEEHVGEHPITVDLFAKSKNGVVKKVDSVSDYVYFIER